MSEHIEFTPKGLVLHKWDEDKRKFVRKRPKKLTVCTHLRSRCEIAEGTTLRQIFEAVDRYRFLKLVIGQYSWCRAIDEFHAQAQEPMQRREDAEQIDYLEIYHWPEVHKYTEKKKHPGGTRERKIVVDFDTSVGFHGIGPAKGDDLQYSTDGTIPYSVSYSPMYEIADLPVKLKKEFTVYTPFEPGKKTEDREILKATREFTLLEVLDAIYWDISFMGGPDDNAEFLGCMNERMEEIESGQVPMIPMEQVFPTDENAEENDPPKMKVLMHPDVARAFGVDPDSIPLDDKEIIRPDES